MNFKELKEYLDTYLSISSFDLKLYDSKSLVEFRNYNSNEDTTIRFNLNAVSEEVNGKTVKTFSVKPFEKSDWRFKHFVKTLKTEIEFNENDLYKYLIDLLDYILSKIKTVFDGDKLLSYTFDDFEDNVLKSYGNGIGFVIKDFAVLVKD